MIVRPAGRRAWHTFALLLAASVATGSLCGAATPSRAADGPPAEAPAGVVRIPAKGPRQLEALNLLGFDVLSFTRDAHLELVATAQQMATLRSLGWDPSVLVPAGEGQAPKAIDANLGQYHTHAETEGALASLEASHPTLAHRQVIGTSIEGRPLTAIKISDNVAIDEPEPEVLLMGCLHARELMSVEIPLRFAEHLLANYGADPQITRLIDERELWVVPMLNPDGHVYVQNNHGAPSFQWWRKNRRNNGNGSFGVDLNRNFGYQWGYDTLGSSSNPSSSVYRGPAPFSEPETQAVRNFCASRQFAVAFSFHSYSELLLWAWGYDYLYAPDHELLAALGDTLTAANGYLPGTPATGAIYLTNGGSDDWMYGDTTTKPRLISFTPEVNSLAEGGFAPAESLIAPTFQRLLPMNLLLLEYADDPRRALGPAAPLLDSPDVTAFPGHRLTWGTGPAGDPNPPVSWDVRAYRDPDLLSVDDAETPHDRWILNGFTRSTARAFGGASSYWSGSGDGLSHAMQWPELSTVTADNDTLWCRLWWNTEQDYDYAYVEVSADQGLTWTTLAGNVTTNTNPIGSNRGNGITGSSAGWQLASFPLTAYVGADVLLRVHYVTDGGVAGEGIYVDDVGPVPGYAQVDWAVVGLTTPGWDFVPPQVGSWLYRVRARDAQGDHSRLSNASALDFDPVTAVLSDPGDIAARALRSRLSGNHPNPFNPRTEVRFTVATPAGAVALAGAERAVALEVFAVTGRRVATLVRGELPPGEHVATWNGTATDGGPVAGGVYFVLLSVDGVAADARKVVLAK